MSQERLWILFGLTGQLMFTGRFVVQWLSSERQKRSVIPRSFWYMSIGGALILLLYSVHRRDVVFILGQSSGLFIYVRNLQLLKSESATCRLREQEVGDHEVRGHEVRRQEVRGQEPDRQSPAAAA